MTKKIFLASYGLHADPEPGDVPPFYSKQDETHHTQSSGSAVGTFPTNTKSTTLATAYQLPLVPVMDQNGGATDIVCTASGPDLGKSSPSSDRTSSPAQEPNAWERVPSQPGSSSDNETTMDLPASRHEPPHTCKSTTSTRIMAASILASSTVSGNARFGSTVVPTVSILPYP